MTKASIYKKGNTYTFKCCGHSGFAKRGEDIICASVSTLCFSLLRFLEGAQIRGEIKNLTSHIDHGSFFINFQGVKSEAVYGLKSILCGFKILQEHYGDFVCYSENM